jgi:hypothetical protein
MTTYVPPHPLSRATSFGISLAGPAVGLVLGAVLVAVARTVELDPFGLGAYTLDVALFTTIGWSVLNLLPIVPLDGGQAMRELLPGSPEVRARRAAMVSIVFAVAVGLVALSLGYTFGAIYAAFFVLVNALSLRSPPGPAQQADVARRAVQLLWDGHPDEARAVLQSAPPGTSVDLAVHGAVLATTGDREQGFALLYQEWARRPGDGDVTALIALAHLVLREWHDLARLLTGPSASFVPPELVARAVAQARQSGDEASAEMLERAARAASGGAGADGR